MKLIECVLADHPRATADPNFRQVEKLKLDETGTLDQYFDPPSATIAFEIMTQLRSVGDLRDKAFVIGDSQ